MQSVSLTEGVSCQYCCVHCVLHASTLELGMIDLNQIRRQIDLNRFSRVNRVRFVWPSAKPVPAVSVTTLALISLNIVHSVILAC